MQGDLRRKNLLSNLTWGVIGVVLSMGAHSAPPFDPSNQPFGYVAPIVLSDSDLSSGTVTAYRPWFENGAWQGDIIQYDVSAGGALSSSVDVSGPSPVNTGAGANWSALLQLKAAENSTPGFWDTSRKIITYSNGGQVPFRWNALSAVQQAALDPTTAAGGPSSLLNWVRGDRRNESVSGGYRVRLNLLGDFVHANPVYVGAPDDGYEANAYATWAKSLNSRAPRIYAGANDGMLHVFDADTGDEVYAYIPSMLLGNLSYLATRPYAHRYYVDGKLTAADAYVSGSWRTLLAGTLGAGGKGLFLLDITDPNLSSESSANAADQKVLWEIDAGSDDDLGYTFSKPLIAQLPDDEWYVVLGNGYGSVNGVAMLYLVNIESGAITRVSTGAGDPTSPNGLSTPALIDGDRDGIVDTAFAGDLNGQLWKFDLSASSPGSWGVAYNAPLYAGTEAQPITAAPDVTSHPYGGYLVAFGTGRLHTSDDIFNRTPQAVVGIRDDGSTPPTAAQLPSKLLSVPWLEGTYTAYDVATSSFSSESEQVGLISPDAGDVNWSTQVGWKQELPDALRVLEDVQIRGGRVKTTLSSPDLSATWIAENVYLDGGPETQPIYDLNADGALGYYDRFGAPGLATGVPMAWRRGTGILSRATIGRVANGADAIFINRLEPYYEPPCEGECVGGFQGGHMDVDSWHTDIAIDGSSQNHDHEYDKKYERVYVDAYDMHLDNDNGHVELSVKDESWTLADCSATDCIANDREFIIVVANADFSPGSEMTVGTKTRNVVQYQREIHNALKRWTDADADPLDSDGDSLVFTHETLVRGGGTLRQSFDSMAIVAGGLHPSSTGCVKGNPDETYDMTTHEGRWRNGALTTMIIDAGFIREQLASGAIGSAIEALVVQKPRDLIEGMRPPYGSYVSLTEDYNGNGLIEDANHERMGGLLAANGSERLWEMTMFWHSKTGCYGSDSWVEDRVDAIEAELGNEEEYADVIADLREAAALANCPDTDAGCDPQTLVDEALAAIFERLFGIVAPPGVGGGDGETAEVLGEDFGSTVTRGPMAVPGRRSWTDVVLQ